MFDVVEWPLGIPGHIQKESGLTQSCFFSVKWQRIAAGQVPDTGLPGPSQQPRQSGIAESSAIVADKQPPMTARARGARTDQFLNDLPAAKRPFSESPGQDHQGLLSQCLLHRVRRRQPVRDSAIQSVGQHLNSVIRNNLVPEYQNQPAVTCTISKSPAVRLVQRLEFVVRVMTGCQLPHPRFSFAGLQIRAQQTSGPAGWQRQLGGTQPKIVDRRAHGLVGVKTPVQMGMRINQQLAAGGVGCLYGDHRISDPIAVRRQVLALIHGFNKIIAHVSAVDKNNQFTQQSQ